MDAKICDACGVTYTDQPKGSIMFLEDGPFLLAELKKPLNASLSIQITPFVTLAPSFPALRLGSYTNSSITSSTVPRTARWERWRANWD